MYPNDISPAAVFSALHHFITDIFHHTVQLIGAVIGIGIVVGVGVLVVIAIAYAFLSIEGHRLERPVEEL